MRSGYRKRVCLLATLLCFSAAVSAQSLSCPANFDFESGGFSNWALYSGSVLFNTWNPPGFVTPGSHTVTSGNGVDPHGGFTVVAPGGGNYSMKLGQGVHGDFQDRARYYIRVPANAGNYSFVYKMAVVLEDPGHPQQLQPKMMLTAHDSATGLPVPCAERRYVAASNLPGFGTSPLDPDIHYLPWNIGTIDLSGYAGSTVILDVETYACYAGYHFAYGYFDVISCGPYEASVSNCDFNSCGLTLTAPPGFQTYQWYKANGAAIGNTQTVTCVAPQNPPAPYFVVMTPYGGMGCKDTLQTKTIADISLQVTDSICLQPGIPYQINTNISGGIPPIGIQWQGSGLSCNDCANPTFTSIAGQPFIIKIKDSNNCVRSDTLRFFQGSFTVDAGDSIVVCIGTPMQLNATVTPWAGNYTYKWTPGAGLNSTAMLQPSFTPSASTLGTATYVLQVDSGYCSRKDSITITTLPNDFAVHDTAICKGVVFQFPVTPHPAFTYQWSPAQGVSNPAIVNPVISVDTTTVFTLTAINQHCPQIIKTVTVDVQPVPLVDLGPDLSKCQWDIIPMNPSVQPPSYPHYGYTWIAHPDLFHDGTGQLVFAGQKDTTLWLTVRTPAGCTGSDSVRVTVHPGNFASITPVDTFICPGQSVTIKVSGGESYQWTPTTYLSGIASAIKLSSPLRDVTYTVVATDYYGCKDTVYSSVNLYSEAFTGLPDTVFLYPGEVYQMDPGGGNALYYHWWPPTGLTAPPGVNPTAIANPTAAPDVDSKYYVEAFTEAGCRMIDSIYIIIIPETYIDIPNAFSPGSAPNELFKVIKKGEATLNSFRVYNRWGNKVFETKNIDEGWDGRYNGVPQPFGVYVFIVEAVTKAGKQFRRVGNVTLIR